MRKIVFICILAVFSTACSDFQRVLKEPNWRTRYDAAMVYYEKGDYYRAGILLEELMPIIRGQKEGEKAMFYFAYTYYKQDMFSLAAHYFKEFFTTFNRSEFAEESLYMHAYSLFRDSSPVHLDQSSTRTAIDAFQEFLNRYPQSKYAKQATSVLQEMRIKLETKAYEIAKQYYTLSRFKAAVIAFDNFQKDFPDSYMQEEIAFLKVKAQHDLAKRSFWDKKKERFEKAMVFYQTFVDKYPDSKYLKQAQALFEDSQKQLKQIAEESKSQANS